MGGAISSSQVGRRGKPKITLELWSESYRDNDEKALGLPWFTSYIFSYRTIVFLGSQQLQPHNNYSYNYNNNYNNNYNCNYKTTTKQLQLQLYDCNYTTLIKLHHNYNSTTLQLPTTVAVHHTTSSSCGWGDHCNHCNHSTTFRSISGFALPSVIHNNQRLL